MVNRPCAAAALFAALSLLPGSPVFSAVTIITHAKALSGGVTPGDAAGYPVSITVPGSFQLDSNLFVAADKIGIQVTSKNVTIDLNGFTLEGSDVAWYGIVGGVNAVTIANGTITQSEFDGINGGAGSYWIVDNVRSIENGRDGIVLGGFALIKSSVIVGNSRRGIYSTTSGVIQGNTIAANGAYGIDATAALVIGNVVNVNGSSGLSLYGSSVVGNLINGNKGDGINAATTGYSGNTVIGNFFAQVTGASPSHPNTCSGGCP